MIARSCMTGLLLGLTMLAASPQKGCSKSPPQSKVKLEQVDVPRGVFSFSGEVVAFRASGGDGREQKVGVPLDSLRARFGRFDRALLYEFDDKGKRLSTQTLNLGPDASVSFHATAGRLYLAFADLGQRYSDSYALMCGFHRTAARARLVPRICTEILCSNEPFRASDLRDRVPELNGMSDAPDLGGGLVGGFGGGLGGFGPGGVCDRCTGLGDEPPFTPVKECSSSITPGGSVKLGEVVYQHKDFPSDTEGRNSQIFKMSSDGSGVVNLSNNDRDEFHPDVNGDGRKIIFARVEGLHVMDIDGTNVTAIPNTRGGVHPKWGPRADTTQGFIIFVQQVSGSRSAIFLVAHDASQTNPLDGARKVQVTTPGDEESDEQADNVDGKHVVFSRLDRSDNLDRDLFIKYIWDDRPAQRLTNTPNESEGQPVISHDRRLIAFRAFLGEGRDDVVRVGRLTLDASGAWAIVPQSTIDLRLPADINISGIDFSPDDTRLYIATQAREARGVSTNLINRRMELFSVRLDGTDQRQLTSDADEDTNPSAVPRP